MEQLQTFVEYVRTNPAVAAGAVVGVVVLYYLLNRKSRLSRAADEQMDRLRRERADYYTKLRPPR
jgi:predicted PurR-regulated permease PerM